MYLVGVFISLRCLVVGFLVFVLGFAFLGAWGVAALFIGVRFCGVLDFFNVFRVP